MNIDEALEYAQNALEMAFENWLETERPSGDCESVHRQWDDSFAHQELVDELQPVMALTWEVRRLREENERLRKWIRVEGDHNDTCTRQILGETCQGCQCTHGEIDAARCAKPEPTP
jgi:hypothetical protein